MTDRSLILIVTSDNDSLSMLSELFSGAGFATAEVGEGQQGLNYVRHARPALVLLDLKLADMSGYEVCYQLRQRYGEEISIILMSGERTEPEDRVAGLLIGADDYITKPSTRTSFLRGCDDTSPRPYLTAAHPIRRSRLGSTRYSVSWPQELGLTRSRTSCSSATRRWEPMSNGSSPSSGSTAG